MLLEQRIGAFIKLNHYLQAVIEGKESQEIIASAIHYNTWFTPANVTKSIQGIIQLTKESALKEWVSKYAIADKPTGIKVGIVMAGNIPMVGFHDLLSVVISGHTAMAKTASDDKYLMMHLIQKLYQLAPEIIPLIEVSERLNQAKAMIATGSNNSSRYFEQYFAKMPNIIRRNRNSVAVLTGKETTETLQQLGNDIFDYFGLGCRNVAKLYVPEGYVFNTFYEALEQFDYVFAHHKYKNNYDYNKSVYLINMAPHLDNGFLLLKEDTAMISPISVVFYEQYKNDADLTLKLSTHANQIQCVVGNRNDLLEMIPFGEAQQPGLFDYADGVDVLEFLTSIK
ncbi:MAG: hypothetical protein RL711_511 [Bacteroidota bacterium]